MAMILHPTLRNRTAVQNTDRIGKLFIEAADALVATGTWRWKQQGDGLSMFSTATTRQFTANGGLGYTTNGTAWNTAIANSFTNLRAWFLLEEIGPGGIPTGRQFMAQRSSNTATTSILQMNIALAWGGFTGSGTANSPPASGTSLQYLFGSAANATGISFVSGFTSPNPFIITGASTLTYDVWIPSGLSGETANVAPFAVVCYDASVAGNDYGSVLIYEALLGVPGDAHPCLAGWNTWAGWWGETLADNPGAFRDTGQPMYCVGPGGVPTLTSFAQSTMPNLTNEPTNSASNIADINGKYPMFQPHAFLEAAANVAYKGRAENLVWHSPFSASYLFPHTFHAVTPHATEPPRVSMGYMAMPWTVGVVPSSNVAVVDRTDMYSAFSTAAPVDSTAPTIGTISPAPGVIGLTDALSVSVTDVGGLARVAISVDYSAPDRHDVAFAGLSSVAGYDGDYDAGSTVTAITNGFTYSVIADGGWRGPFTLRVTAIDRAGNQTTLTGAYTLSQSTQPTVTNVSPSASSAIGPTQALAFRTNDARGLLSEIVYAQLGSDREVVWTGTAFAPAYAGSTRTTINAGRTFDYSVVRSPGWPAAPTLGVQLVDTDGLTLDTSWGYTLSASAQPAVTLISPPASSIISTIQTISFRVSDPTGILREQIYVEYPNGIREVVWTGGQFTDSFAASDRTIVNAGRTFDYVIRRSDSARGASTPIGLSAGWSLEPTFYVSITDVDSNIVDTTWAYSLASSTQPQVSVTPASGEIDVAEQLTIDITDTIGLLIFFISVQYESSAPMVVYNGSALSEGFLEHGSVSVISDGRRVVVLPDDGWEGAFLLSVKVIDTDGQMVNHEASYQLAVPAPIPAPMPTEGLGPEYTPRTDIVERAQGRLLEQFRE